MEESDYIKVYGARENNLKNIDVQIPHGSLTVITGLSGSGKSSLAFNTLYAEGQRRYIETFSSYARNFLGGMERPDVDKITGLNPVIAIEQKTTNNNPRSTVGTTTEIYDFLRLLYARVADAYSYNTGEKMVRYSHDQILGHILGDYDGKKILLLAPLVHSRKGHYRELFEQLRKKGYLNVRVDGEMREIVPDMRLDRYKNHDIEVVIDKLKVESKDEARLKRSLKTAMEQGDGIVAVLDNDDSRLKYYSSRLMCPSTGLSYPDPAPHDFSFNSPKGYCPRCHGMGVVSQIDMQKLIPDNTVSIHDGAITALGKYRNNMTFNLINNLCLKYGCDLKTPVKDLPEELLDTIINGSDELVPGQVNSDGVRSAAMSFHGICAYLMDLAQDENSDDKTRRWAEQFTQTAVCPECQGSRLNKKALYYKIDGKNIAELSSMDIGALGKWVEDLPAKLDERQKKIGTEILKEIKARIGFLNDVGLHYLSLNRASASLSGGESQRIRLATQIGSQLVNVLYILDEPSIGLHPRDNIKLIGSLKKLRDEGNTVIVVEHDKDMMLSSDYIIDMGPGAGRLGGYVVFQGTTAEMLEAGTLTAAYLNGKKEVPRHDSVRPGNGKSIILHGATGNNLKNVDVEFPLGKFICITGVSGGGKSTLISETLLPILTKHFYRSLKQPLPYKSIEGIENIDKVIAVDQSPIGRTPRSNPATYTGLFADIRNLFVELPESKIRGYKPGRFSFNVKGGRCEECMGAGYKKMEMGYMSDVYVRCEACRGKRYNRETLEVRYKGKSIGDVLDMTINQAAEFFENVPSIMPKLRILQEVGLGYIKLGQSSTTLSGGENQRVKLATELAKKDTGHTLYILDEPTTGLHFEDIKVLLEVLDRLVDRGNSLIVIEHNLDVILHADHIIDLGPEGGSAGGRIVAQGTIAEVRAEGKGATAAFL